MQPSSSRAPQDEVIPLQPDVITEPQSKQSTLHRFVSLLGTITTTTMSRRPPNPAADRAAQNLATLKSLLKLEANKTCADCKRNKRELVVAVHSPLSQHCHGWCADQTPCYRSAMGELEPGRIRLHPMLRHPSRHGHTHQSS